MCPDGYFSCSIYNTTKIARRCGSRYLFLSIHNPHVHTLHNSSADWFLTDILLISKTNYCSKILNLEWLIFFSMWLCEILKMEVCSDVRCFVAECVCMCMCVLYVLEIEWRSFNISLYCSGCLYELSDVECVCLKVAKVMFCLVWCMFDNLILKFPIFVRINLSKSCIKKLKYWKRVFK